MTPSTNTPAASASSSSLSVSPTPFEGTIAVEGVVEPVIVPQALSDAAVARMATRIAAMSETDLAPANRDPQRAADIVLRSLPALEANRGLLESTYRAFDFSRLDSLKDAAYAAKYHNGSAHAAPEEEDVLRAALEKATTTRDEMLSVVQSLATRKKMSKSVTEEIVRSQGYSETAGEITKLVGALRASWSTVEEYAGIKKHDVDAALRDADALTEAISKREKANARFAAGTLLKQQSFTLMVRDYDYVRSALVFPLAQAGKPGPDTFAPSVYAVKKPRKSAPGEEVGETGAAKKGEDTEEIIAPVVELTTPVVPGVGDMTRPFA